MSDLSEWLRGKYEEALYDVIHLRSENERFRLALQKIAYQDYRGGRSEEMEIAYDALNPHDPRKGAE